MLTNYIKVAWKVLLRHPFYTFITLFGISLTLTILMVLTSFLDHIIGSHYPETNRDRLLYLQHIRLTDSLGTSSQGSPASYHFLKKYVKTLKTPEKVGITSYFSFANAYVKGRRLNLSTKFTDAEFWQVTNFQFLEGKPFNESNIARGDQVAVISDDLKRQYFDDETQPVIGKTIEVDNARFRVIGVVKAVPVTRPVTSADIYFPYNIAKSNYQDKGFGGNFVGLVLARQASDLPAIQQEFDAAVSRIPIPGIEHGNFKFYHMYTGLDTYLDSWLRNFNQDAEARLFFGAVGIFMLLFMGLPAINLVNVNVGRMMERASEIGIRKAFGAPVRTLVWQFIIENIFITFLGGILALVLSAVIIYLINASGWIAHADLTINFSVFAVSILICLTFGFLSGVVPALRMSRMNIVEALKAA